MEKIPFSIGKCKTKAAFSAKLPYPVKMDLKKIKSHFEVILETPLLLVVKVEGIEVIVQGFGELLFKKCEDVSLMEKIARRIYQSGIIVSDKNNRTIINRHYI